MYNKDLMKRAIEAFQQDVHNTAVEKGWWEKPREIGTTIALMHSELSEALEAARVGNPPDDKIPKFGGIEAEMADTIIRILDFCGHHNLDVVGAMFAKAEYNKSRAYRHGGKEF